MIKRFQRALVTEKENAAGSLGQGSLLLAGKNVLQQWLEWGSLVVVRWGVGIRGWGLLPV